MKYLVLASVLLAAFYSCNSGKTTMKENINPQIVKNDTIRISNPDFEYEIIIIEPGFDSWLVTQPPQSFHSITHLEGKNRLYVSEYNRRVRDMQYSRIIYPQQIDYDPTVHYGLEVNYLLYNYFKYFEKTYKQKLY